MPRTRPVPTGFIDPALAGAQEIEALRADMKTATEMLADKSGEPVQAQIVLRAANGQLFKMSIPRAWSAEMLQELAVLINGESVRWQAVESSDEVGTKELAEILGVSIPTATKVLDWGHIASRITPGGHRRVRRADAIAWRLDRDRQRETLRDLVQMAEQLESAGNPMPSGTDEDPDDES